jgi:hypothetical protein
MPSIKPRGKQYEQVGHDQRVGSTRGISRNDATLHKLVASVLSLHPVEKRGLVHVDGNLVGHVRLARSTITSGRTAK